MKCNEAQEIWQQRLDGEIITLPTATVLEAHLQICRSCRQLHEALPSLMDALVRLDTPLPPRGLDALISDSWLRIRRRRRQVMVATALAATVLIAAAGVLYYQSHHLANTNFAQRQPSPAITGAQPLERVVEEAGSALVGLTRRTADETWADGRLLLPDVMPPQDDASTSLFVRALDTPATSLRQAGSGLSTGLEPVATSARRAVNMFWQDVAPIAAPSERGL